MCENRRQQVPSRPSKITNYMELPESHDAAGEGGPASLNAPENNSYVQLRRRAWVGGADCFCFCFFSGVD